MVRRSAVISAALGLLGLSVAFPAAPAGAVGARAAEPALHVEIFGHSPTIVVSGHPFSPIDPDDLTSMRGHIFVNYQNGVGAQGEPAPDGTTFSTIIEYSAGGQIDNFWNLTGKSDGLTADLHRGVVISTLNEDGNTSLATIDPDGPTATQVVTYQYQPGNPLPHGGGTDGIAIFHGKILISASAPGNLPSSGTTPATMPAVYRTTLIPDGRGGGTARLTPVFFDGSSASVANTAAPTESPVSPNPPAWGSVPAEGTVVSLALTDPDSNEVVPDASPRFAGDFVLDSQGDQQLIFAARPGTSHQQLSVLDLSQSIDDSGFVGDRGGSLVMTDATDNEVVRVSGDLEAGQVFASATPGNGNNPGTGPNYVATIDLSTGTVSAVPALSAIQPKGMIFVSRD
jgi:hypothetical protein